VREMAAPRLILILSENWTLVSPRDLPAVIRMAVEAEDAGFDGVLVSEHVVLGRGADAQGLPANPRDWAWIGNQDPAMPWPDSQVLLAAVAAATTRLRLVASAVIAPLRHPLLLAKALGTLDLLSQGRLVVQPSVSWHQAEYEALGVPFHRRGELLDEHLAAWQAAWGESPASFDGRHYRFTDVWVEPKPYRPGGPSLWFGGSSLHGRLLHRLIVYGSAFYPLGGPGPGELDRLEEALRENGRDPAELELVADVSGSLTDATSAGDLYQALEAVPAQLAQGFTTLCVKPSQFTDDPADVGPLCRDVVARVAALVA
jgi:probable F420-dependent oxidoreductase